MKILFVTSECAPYSKSGGLADVAFSLPPALKKTGDEIAVITPLYQCVRDRFNDQLTFVEATTVRLGERELYCGLSKTVRDNVTIWFIDNEELFRRPRLYGYDDDAFRFAWFSRAVINLLPHLDFMPDILHCNDWETALAVIYLRNDQTFEASLQGIRTVYTIHNIAYQGQFGASELQRTFALDGGWYQGGLGYEYQGRHDLNLMKGAMLMSDAVSTVSPTYARELHDPTYGMGLQGVADMVEYKLYGILNGIDMVEYDPAQDKKIPANFSVDDMSGKAACKAYIQENFGLDRQSRWPLLVSVARLNEQKGIELIKEILPSLMNMGVQLLVFGQGEQKYIDYFEWAQKEYPGQLGFSSDYTEEMAKKIFAGADMYLMPSRFEPCGLSQMMAMRFGTVPIVHEIGGLKDSVRPYSDFDGIGDGFSFGKYTGKALYQAILQAVKIYFGEEDTFALIRRRCMTKDLSWNKSAGQYNRMYSEICSGGGTDISFEEAFKELKAAYLSIDEHNRRNIPEIYSREFSGGRHCVMQVHVTGKGEGVFYVEFREDETVVEPYCYDLADFQITASYDTLIGMARGELDDDVMFMNGQLKIDGNISRGHMTTLFLRRQGEAAGKKPEQKTEAVKEAPKTAGKKGRSRTVKKK